ncbi:hypothetical protein FACS189425_05780 [Clostridia bacterium]|nr:hypothetical protein FACS189425_05780 [Clostridia bacterium]
MGFMTKKILSLALVALIVLTFAPAVSESATTYYYYGAVDNALMPAAERYMPVMVAGSMLISTSLLMDSGAGFTAQYFPALRLLRITDGGYTLNFDMRENYAYDTSAKFNYYAIELSGVFYMPMHFILERFGMSYSTVATEYGSIIRLRTGAAASSDASFLSDNLPMLSEQERYYRELNGLPQRPAPASPQPSVILSPSPTPDKPTPTPIVDLPPPRVYLMFDVEDGLKELLDVLDELDVKATLFLTDGAIKNESASVRRAVGTGYAIGALGDSLSAVREATAALTKAAMRDTRLARLSGATDEIEAYDIQQAGYRLWEPTDTNAADIDGTRPAYLLANGDIADIVDNLKTKKSVFGVIRDWM